MFYDKLSISKKLKNTRLNIIEWGSPFGWFRSWPGSRSRSGITSVELYFGIKFWWLSLPNYRAHLPIWDYYCRGRRITAAMIGSESAAKMAADLHYSNMCLFLGNYHFCIRFVGFISRFFGRMWLYGGRVRFYRWSNFTVEV